MSQLQVGDLAVVIKAACKCLRSEKDIGHIFTVRRIFGHSHGAPCSFCRKVEQVAEPVAVDERLYGWPVSCVKKIEPLPKEETTEKEKELEYDIRG